MSTVMTLAKMKTNTRNNLINTVRNVLDSIETDSVISDFIDQHISKHGNNRLGQKAREINAIIEKLNNDLKSTVDPDNDLIPPLRIILGRIEELHINTLGSNQLISKLLVVIDDLENELATSKIKIAHLEDKLKIAESNVSGSDMEKNKKYYLESERIAKEKINKVEFDKASLDIEQKQKRLLNKYCKF